jgi:hypothetical protein
MPCPASTIKKENITLRRRLNFLLDSLERRKFCYSVLAEYRAKYSSEEIENLKPLEGEGKK